MCDAGRDGVTVGVTVKNRGDTAMGERIETSGLATMLAVLGASGGLQDGEGGQVELFDCEEAPLPLPSKGVSGPKGGRPRGARNKSTDAWVQHFLSQHRSPLMVLGNIAGQPLAELHELLQDMADKRTRQKFGADGRVEEVRVLVDPLAVLKLQRDAAVALLPYVHKAQPKAIEIEERKRGFVLLGDLPEAEADQSDDLALPLPKIEENQGSATGAREQSDDMRSRKMEIATKSNPLAFDGD